jgi:BRCA1/BRCA2-containing complex subunit 3
MHLQDRVETSPEQMAACSALAEHVSSSTGLPTRVVGWYHSHPHITVLPSHVDVNTQVCIHAFVFAGMVVHVAGRLFAIGGYCRLLMVLQLPLHSYQRC